VVDSTSAGKAPAARPMATLTIGSQERMCNSARHARLPSTCSRCAAAATARKMIRPCGWVAVYAAIVNAGGCPTSGWVSGDRLLHLGSIQGAQTTEPGVRPAPASTARPGLDGPRSASPGGGDRWALWCLLLHSVAADLPAFAARSHPYWSDHMA
jgi:hypothetical protein